MPGHPDNNEEQTPVRELTQTDKLNKKLLSSLLENLNSGENPVLNSLTNQPNTEQDDSENTEFEANSTD